MIIGGANRAEQMVQITTEDAKLEGTILLPAHAKGVVIFVHGNGGSRFSQTIQHVAEALFHNNIAALRFEMLTIHEEEMYSEMQQLGVDWLAQRIVGVTDWVLQRSELNQLPLGYWGEDIGASATVIAATQRACISRAIVAHGQLIDMTEDIFVKLQTPVKGVVRENDLAALNTNQKFFAARSSAQDLQIIPDGTESHKQCEALEALAALAVDWYQTYLPLQTLTYEPPTKMSCCQEAANAAEMLSTDSRSATLMIGD